MPDYAIPCRAAPPTCPTWPEAARKEHLKQQLLATPLAEMKLPVRVVNVLEEHGVILVKDLVRQSYETLMSMTNFGGKTLKTVVVAPRKLGVNHRSGKRQRRRR